MPQPPELSRLPILRELELESNFFTGSVPSEWIRLTDTLSAILLADNELEGNLYPLAL